MLSPYEMYQQKLREATGSKFGLHPPNESQTVNFCPGFCASCFEKAPMGGIEAEVGVLFADVRGYTALAEGQAPGDVTRLLNRFYETASRALISHDAVVDKLVGDEVMGLFLPGVAGKRLADKMASVADGVLRGVGYGSASGTWLQLGIGLDIGHAFVGNVGGQDIKDFTAIGDVVNTAARLASVAKAGQAAMSERVYQVVSDRYPHAAAVRLELKGKSEPVAARIIER